MTRANNPKNKIAQMLRTGEITNIKCYCDISGIRLFYVSVMTHWCRHWSKYKYKAESEET